jgi:ribonuclease PH
VNRRDGRSADQLRTLEVCRNYVHSADGSVLLTAGGTVVLCTACVDTHVPPWLEGRGKGWVTAEYSMLPGSTRPRKPRDRGGRVDGRTTEIQRLIGRSLRAVVDLRALGTRTITVDCDVLQADGGTRTASINGAFLALVDAIHSLTKEPDPPQNPLRDSVAAVSVGLVDGTPLLDLDYPEDLAATVDMNVVMTGSGRFVEIQGTGEESTFSEMELATLLQLARQGIHQLTQIQRLHLGELWPRGRTAEVREDE